MRVSRLFIVVCLAVGVLAQDTAAQQSLTFALFERYVDALRLQAGIPGISAVIVRDRQIVWERGFGSQDVDRSLPASPDTPYLIGDLSQTFSATLTLQCLDEADVSLDDRIRRWTDALPEASTTVRQLLSHSSPARGGAFAYDPSRYEALTSVISYCHGRQPLQKILADRVLDRLGMFGSVPGQDLADSGSSARDIFDQTHLDRYESVLSRLAVPYRVSGGKPTRSQYPAKGLNAATGIVSTARDLAKYDAGLDDTVLLRSDRLAAAWTNSTSVTGATLPTGLGWFVQTYNGQRIVWHFGLLPNTFSSLMLKVPGRNITLILLANSDGLSAPFSLANGDVTTSVFAQAFLRTFVP